LSDDEKKERGPTVEQKLREIAARCFTTYRAPDGRMYGSATGKPQHAIRHGNPSELMQSISLAYLDRWGSWPNKESRAAVTSYLEAITKEIRPVPVRCHWDRRRLLLYVADTAGTILVLDGRGVRELEQVDVAFRRPPSAAPLPWPLATSGDISLLWKIVRVVEADRPIVLALLIMSWLTGLPQPVVLITGPADAGKTTTARYLLSLVDPVTHQRGGSLPEKEDEWKARIGQARVVFIDNSSHITAKTSDLMCRVATGGELTKRELYTDDGAHVSDLLIPIWLTSIDSGVLRGDLQSRIVPIELEAINETDRLVLSDLETEQEQAWPAITRGLLDLTDQVVAALPAVDRSKLVHRMTDFNLVLRCVDEILGTTGEARLAGQSAELARDVLDADPIALALLHLVDDPATNYIGDRITEERLAAGITAEDLLEQMNRATPVDKRGQGWPSTPKVLSSRLRTIAPAMLQARDIRIEFGRTKKARSVRVFKVGGDSPSTGPGDARGGPGDARVTHG
jgi:hypothetical protein